MYMRIVRAQPPEGQADALAQKWKAFFPERLRAQPGFRHAHLGIDRATGAIAAVTVFDEKPDNAQLERILREFRDTLGATGPAQDPEVTLYEVAAEV